MSQQPRDLLEFDVYCIDVGQRVLFSRSTPVPLSPKVFDTLLALAEEPGRVLEKDYLLKKIWPDTFVEEGSLARNVSTLRRVLGKSPEDQEYIETIPKRGYRFKGAVRRVSGMHAAPAASDLLADDVPSEDGRESGAAVEDVVARRPTRRFVAPVTVGSLAPIPAPPSRLQPPGPIASTIEAVRLLLLARFPWRAMAALVALTSVIGFVTWRRAAEPSLGGPAPFRQVTTDAAFSTMPSLSPDGALLAYASDRAGRGDLDIWTQQSNGGQLLRLTDDPADDDSPSFAPDSRLVAFRSDRKPAGIYVVPALGGDPRLIVEGGRRPQFSPNGKWLAYWTGQWRGPAAEQPTESYVIPLTGGTPRRLLEGFVVARDPTWAPDGQSLLVLGRTSSRLEDLDWWWVPLESGEPHATHALDRPGLRLAAASAPARLALGAWASDGVVYTHDGNLWSLDISSKGVARGQPRRLTYGTGSYQEPSISRNGAVAFAVSEPRRVIERASLLSPAESPVRLYADRRTGYERVTQTRDGSTIVLERVVPPTLREVVARNVVTGVERVVLRIESTNRLNATVSPDGERIAYTLTPIGSSSAGDGFVVDTAGGIPRRVCQNCEALGFLSDSRHLVIVGADAASIELIDSASNETRALLRVSGRGERIDRPHISPDDLVIAFRVTRGDAQKVYVAPMPQHGLAGTHTWQEIQEPTTTGRPIGWAGDSSVLYLFLDTDGFRCVWGQRVNRATGKLDGTPFTVRHFHQTQGLTIMTGFGNAVASGSFVYEYSAPAANIWQLYLPAAE